MGHALSCPRSVTRKRIAIVALPVLMEELVRRTCASDASLEIVEPSVASIEAFLGASGPSDVDVIITAAQFSDTRSQLRRLLVRQPAVRLLVIEQQDGEGILIELLPTRTTLGFVNTLELLRAITDDTTHHAAWKALDVPVQRRQA